MDFSEVKNIDGEQYVKFDLLENEFRKTCHLQKSIQEAINYLNCFVNIDSCIINGKTVKRAVEILSEPHIQTEEYKKLNQSDKLGTYIAVYNDLYVGCLNYQIFETEELLKEFIASNHDKMVIIGKFQELKFQTNVNIL